MDKIKCLLVNNSTQKVVISSKLKTKLKIFLCADENEGLKLLNDAKTLFSRALYFPPKDIFYYSADASSSELIEQRIKVLEFLSKNQEGVIITTIEAAIEKLDNISSFIDSTFRVELAMNLNANELKKRLIKSGYSKVSKVYGRGEFAQRGSIIDIFTFTHDYPIRIELFDDEVDSLRYFDIETQRGIENISFVEIFVAKDTLNEKDSTSLLQMSLDTDTTLILDEPSRLINVLDTIMSSSEQINRDKFIDIDLAKSIIYSKDTLSFAIVDGGGYLETINVNINSSSVQKYNGNIYEMISDCKKWISKDYRIRIYCASILRAKRILEEFSQNDIVASIDNENEDIRIVNIITRSLQNSFVDEDEKVVFISDTDIFKDIKKRRIHHEKNEYTEVILTFSDLKIGDIVVHDNYGIGRYQGIESIEVKGVKRDYLKIEYKNNSELYILATNVASIQKYIGNESLVTLNDLNSDRWKNTKERVKKQTDLIAKEIVNLYAKRLDKKGFAFSADNEIQKEMEELFEFVETDDQLNAIKDIKNDMESTKIMDRLLCGDVGFGKTELAIRAAFKAVLDNKQVAILVPTTILAAQHFDVFRKRLEKFAVNIEMLSRFVTPNKQKSIIEGINQGRIDIIIGTQSILKKNIKFRDLGLLIIDEEQRFGVSDKEKIKMIKSDIDTLSLSATPIPRTLNMSLSGIRDLSLLMQPPFDRLPVQVYVLEYKLSLVKEAILREANRGGQVYFLHNNIYDIQEVAKEIRTILPNLRIEVVHSRLSKNEIERIFYEFNDAQIDVLVSTTIVETGLDIPNVNTIIINNADKFGLSSLYQLKGRVGRSNKKAYAYFMYKKGKQLQEKALERLKAIREFNRLGSGIKIAMKDMQIRGTGSLLGNVQHGHIESIGYDMYCKILRESIANARGQGSVEFNKETIIDININMHIDDEYIPTEMEKLEMYKKFNNIYTIEDMYDVIDECNDRFGDIPLEVLNIIKLGFVKNVANAIGIAKIMDTKKTINIKFFERVKINPTKFINFLAENAQKMRFNGGNDNTLYIYYTDLVEDLVTTIMKLKDIKEDEV